MNPLSEAKYDFKEKGVRLMRYYEKANAFLDYIQYKNPEYYEKLYWGQARFPKSVYEYDR